MSAEPLPRGPVRAGPGPAGSPPAARRERPGPAGGDRVGRSRGGEGGRRPAGWCALAVAVALGSQVLLILLLADRVGGGGPDSIEYVRHAENLLDRGLYSYDGVRPDRMRQPLYPLLIAAIYATLGRDVFLVYAIQTLIGCGTVALTWALARTLGLTPAVAGLAGLTVALYPPFARLAGMVTTETLSTLLWVVTARVFVTAARTGRDRHVLWLGALVGLHTLCRPASLFFLPLFLGGLWWSGLEARRALRAGALAVLALGLVVLPWGVRNVVTLGSPTILSSEGGVTLYLAMRPDREQIWAEDMGRFIESPEVRALIGAEYYISERANELFRREGIRLFLQDPAGAIARGLAGSVKAWLYMPGGHTVARDAPWLWVPVVAGPTLLLLLALHGAVGLDSRLARVLILGLPAYSMLVHIPALAHARFALPLFPFVAIGAAAGLERLGRALGAARQPTGRGRPVRAAAGGPAPRPLDRRPRKG